MFLTNIKEFLLNYTPITAGLGSGALGAVGDAQGVLNLGGGAGWAALVCGLAGAAIAGIPKIISSWSSAKLKDSEFVGKSMRSMIRRLQKQATDADMISAITSQVRHTIINYYNREVLQRQYLTEILRDNNIAFHDIPVMEINDIIQKMDEEIKEIKKAPLDDDDDED